MHTRAYLYIICEVDVNVCMLYGRDGVASIQRTPLFRQFLGFQPKPIIFVFAAYFSLSLSPAVSCLCCPPPPFTVASRLRTLMAMIGTHTASTKKTIAYGNNEQK